MGLRLEIPISLPAGECGHCIHLSPPANVFQCRPRYILGIHQRAESFELPGLLACVLTYQDLAE